MRKIAYLAMDLYARNCTLGEMDDSGQFRGTIEFPTTENNIIHALKSVKARKKHLTIEEGPLTGQLRSPIRLLIKLSLAIREKTH